jgi:hypothetical protein
LFAYGFVELSGVSSREIGSPDTSLKKYIATDDDSCVVMDKNNMPGAMAGTMPYFQDLTIKIKNLKVV